MQDKLFQLLDRHFDEMVEIRRHLHENPEVSFHETNTAKYIADYHKKLGNEVQEHVGGNGVVAKISGKNPGPVVASVPISMRSQSKIKKTYLINQKWMESCMLVVTTVTRRHCSF